MPDCKQNSPLDVVSDLIVRDKISCVLIDAGEKLDYCLRPEEEGALSDKAVEKRRLEFVAGRAAANRAMRKLGIEAPLPLPRGRMREPLWPAGIVGSITHSYPWTIAVAARRSEVSTIGIDLESLVRMKEEDISRQICTESELRWIGEFGDPLRALGMIFSSKEAVFKAFSPHCQCYFDFKDARLVWQPEKESFQGELLVDLEVKYRRGYGFEVHCRSSDDWIFAHLIEGCA
jgi:4'-phosphopantetheinyl transferase EntD